jgi:hypothetical protein
MKLLAALIMSYAFYAMMCGISKRIKAPCDGMDAVIMLFAVCGFLFSIFSIFWLIFT